MTDVLWTFKKQGVTVKPAGTCPYVGEIPFEGAQYVRKCASLPNLCSCTYWNKPEVYNQCDTKRLEDQLKGDDEN